MCAGLLAHAGAALAPTSFGHEQLVRDDALI